MIFLLAETLTDMLEDAGATVVGSIGWRDEAFVFVSRDSIKFDTVILDINLHGQPSYPIADVLIERGIHFVFVTGYGAGCDRSSVPPLSPLREAV